MKTDFQSVLRNPKFPHFRCAFPGVSDSHCQLATSLLTIDTLSALLLLMMSESPKLFSIFVLPAGIDDIVRYFVLKTQNGERINPWNFLEAMCL